VILCCNFDKLHAFYLYWVNSVGAPAPFGRLPGVLEDQRIAGAVLQVLVVHAGDYFPPLPHPIGAK
jgi:hypothetical protein